MKIKVILDMSNDEAYKAINYFTEYRKSHPELNLDIHGFDLENDQTFNKVYYGMHYANKYGVGLEFLKRVLDAYYLENKDINDINVLADCFQEIGYDRNDYIDAMMMGDYEEMQNYFQSRYEKENICESCTGIFYADDTKVFNTVDDIKKYLETYKELS